MLESEIILMGTFVAILCVVVYVIYREEDR